MTNRNNKQTFIDFLIPLTLLLALSALFRFSDLDRSIQSNFYNAAQGWLHGDQSPWSQLYHYGPTPAIILAGSAILILLSSLFLRATKPFRKRALFFVLLMALGPGLLVNVVFKDHWGRPRPREIQQFAGQEPFLPVWSKGASGNGYSFPSGHASMGFYLMAPFFVLRRKKPVTAKIFLGGGIGAGLLIGLARMVQGGHFASDIIWSGGFIYLTGMVLYHLLLKDET